MKCFELAKLLTNLFRGQWGAGEAGGPGGGGLAQWQSSRLLLLGLRVRIQPQLDTRIENSYSKSLVDYRDQFCKRIFVRNLRIFVIRQSVCPCQAFPDQSNVCGLGQEPSQLIFCRKQPFILFCLSVYISFMHFLSLSFSLSLSLGLIFKSGMTLNKSFITLAQEVNVIKHLFVAIPE